MLYSALPTASVWPSTARDNAGSWRSRSATRSSCEKCAGGITAELKAKLMRKPTAGAVALTGARFATFALATTGGATCPGAEAATGAGALEGGVVLGCDWVGDIAPGAAAGWIGFAASSASWRGNSIRRDALA